MDGGRGFFSAASGGTPAQGGATRARPVSAGTRLRQKPGGSGAEDFFASLGIDPQSRGRTGSSASTSSNRSFNSMNTRPVSASGAGASGPTSSSAGGWRPPPIGGLGSQRAAPPAPIPPVGSLNVASINRSSLTTSTTSTTTRVGGLSLGSAAAPTASLVAPPVATSSVRTSVTTAVSSVATAAVNRSKPTQLFSMEDAEELYSDDGWDCDSPSTVLSNPADEVEGATATKMTTAPAPVAAAKAQDDEFSWGDDDDAFASPVAKPATPPTQPPPVQTSYEASSAAAMDYSFTTDVSAASAFETKAETTLPSPATTTSVPTSAFSVSSEHAAFERRDFTENEKAQEAHSSFEHATTEFTSTSPTPPAEVPPMALATESTYSGFEVKSFPTQAPPQEAPPIQSFTSNNSHQHEQQWDHDWDQQGEPGVATSVLKTVDVSTTITTTDMTVTTATATQGNTFVPAPVELTSPAAAAGEFWGDGDEDELFDHDDHADEDWDDSIKAQTASLQNMELKSSGTIQSDLAASVLSGQSESLSKLDSSPVHAAYTNEALDLQAGALPVVEAAAATASAFGRSEPAHPDETEATCEGQATNQQAIQAPTELESSVALSPPQSVQTSEMELHSTHDGHDPKHVDSLNAENSPFASAIVEASTPDDDPNVFPEAPPNVRFLHTPTGTGGPFGRVPSPQGVDGPSFQEGFASTATHDAQHAGQNSMIFDDDRKDEQSRVSQPYMESTTPWDSGSMSSNSRGHLNSEGQLRQHDESSHHNNRQGQSDEEERDSVVSFSGENSFFPSAGRPSSLYGGSQSSFASHRMYQSSVASTDHDGSSIASFGVSSAGATFGGSERVSEGGAFSDGTVSETPSMVDSSNASTAFGTDFPSVSEGQFSAPGTTIGGSDNASDGGFSDGNASETTSMCESVNTTPRFVSEFSSSTGHYVTGAVGRHDIQEPFASSPPETSSAAVFGESPPVAGAAMFAGNDSSVDANPFASSPSAFPPSQNPTSTSGAPTDSSFVKQAAAVVQEDGVQSAASLFGATAGADVPNPFSSFDTPPAVPASETKIVEEHELPTSDAGDLFGSSTPSDGFGNSFAQPAQQRAYESGYQKHDQAYVRPGQKENSESPFRSAHSQFTSSSPFDRPAPAVSSSSPFESQRTNSYNTADPFASQNATQSGYGISTPSAESAFNSGGYNGNSGGNHSATSHFAGDASGSATFGAYSGTDTSTSAANHFGHQPNAQTHGGSYGGEQNQQGQGTTSAYPAHDSTSISKVSDHFKNQPITSVDAHAQRSTGTFDGHSYGQSGGVPAVTGTSSGAVAGRLGRFSRQSSASSFASGYGGQNRYGSQQAGHQSLPGTPDNYSQQHSAAQAFASPSQPSYGGQSGSRHSQQFDQRLTPGTPDNHSKHSAAEVFGSTSPAQPSYGTHQDPHQQYEKNVSRSSSGGFGDHVRSSSSASTDAFFGHSTSEAGQSLLSSDLDGRSATLSSGFVYHHLPPQNHAQPSFLQSGSNASSHTEQHNSHVLSSATPTQSYDLNTSYRSVESTGLSRHTSSSSMSRSEKKSSFQSQQSQQHVESPTVPIDANSFFGQTATATEAASSFFGGKPHDSSELQASQQQALYSNTEERSMPQFSSQQEHEMQQQYSQGDEYSGEHFGEGAAASAMQEVEASLNTAINTADSGSQLHAEVSENLQYQASSSLGEGPRGANATNPQEMPLPFATEYDANRPQAFDGFGGSRAQEFGGQTSPDDYFSGSQRQSSDAGAFGQNAQELQAHEAVSSSLQFGASHSSYRNSANESNSGVAANPPGAISGSYLDLGAPGAGIPSPANYAHRQSRQQNYSYQQQQPQHDTARYPGDVAAYQNPGIAYNAAAQHVYGTAEHGHDLVSTRQGIHSTSVPAVKTSNKYKDPCVAPPSCLASFGFGGNVVTMFPKRKLRLNIAGSSYRNSPRGAPVPSEFENSANGELRKGPVNVYRMDQLHPKDREFEQMDIFPGPLSEDVSDEAILEYLDERLKCSEEPMPADEVEDENERLLLGVLRVLVKCNGKLRSEPGTLSPGDPNSPEAQLITLLSDSSKRRSGNQFPVFPAPRKAQSTPHPDLLVKRASDLRDLLLVGDRKGAVSSAMVAHMWPEAMLIASFTDKEEYRRVLRTYLDEHYETGDPCRALFMSFADQQEKSVQEPKRLLQTNTQQSTDSLILPNWVSHAQVLLANRTADTNKILTELGDRLWNELDAVSAAHVCYLLAGTQVEAPMPSAKMALLGGDHRTPKEARFYVSPAAVQRTEVYEWAQKHSKGPAANLMIPFQGYKLIYAMLLADHGKLETAFKYVTSMLTVIKAVTATMKPGSSMYLEGMKNQLTVLDDRLRQHLGQERVASVAASTSRGGGRKQSGKWGLGSALSIMGKIVNRVVEGNELGSAASAAPSATTPGGLYASEASPPAANYPSTPSLTTPTPTPASIPPYQQQHVQQTPPTSSHGPSPAPVGSYGHATPPVSQSSAPGSSNGYNRAPIASPGGAYSRPVSNGIPSSGPFSGNGRLGPLQHQQSSGPFSGNGKPGPSGPYSNSGPASRGLGTVPFMRSQHSIEPPGSNHSTHSNSSFNGMPPAPTPQYLPQQYEQPPSSQTSQQSQDQPVARLTPPAFQRPAPLDVSGDAGSSSASQPKTLVVGLAAEVASSLPPTNMDATTMSGPSSDKGKASPKFKSVKKPARSKTPPPSGSSKSSGWLSGLSSFIATKMNPEAKVAKLGEHLEAYYDEKTKRWVFPGETAAEEPSLPSAPPTGPMPGSAPGSSATGAPPPGANSAPGSMAGGPTPSDDPLAALMAPPPSHMLMKKDPLAAMMAPPSRPGMYGARRGGSTAQRKPPRPQFAVFKPTGAAAPDQQSE